MNDAELQARYPLPPDVRELAETMLNGGKPLPRKAALGVEQMRAILKKLRQDALDTLAVLDECHADVEPVRHSALTEDLTLLKREIADYEQRLQEYQAQQDGLN
jgi:hypothetical protein